MLRFHPFQVHYGEEHAVGQDLSRRLSAAFAHLLHHRPQRSVVVRIAGHSLELGFVPLSKTGAETAA